MKKFKQKLGFTLAELLIVVSIIAILVAISIPIFSTQLEKSRRVVDMSNTRNIIAALKVGINTGDIEFTTDTFENNPTCIAVVVGKDSMKAFVSGATEIEGVSYDNSNGQVGHQRIEEYLKKNSISNYTIKAKNTNNDGWAYYVVFLYSDGSIRIGSGTTDDSSEYNDNTFERHANNWRNSNTSNLEKAMGYK